jgi:hypothetical protein
LLLVRDKVLVPALPLHNSISPERRRIQADVLLTALEEIEDKCKSAEYCCPNLPEHDACLPTVSQPIPGNTTNTLRSSQIARANGLQVPSGAPMAQQVIPGPLERDARLLTSIDLTSTKSLSTSSYFPKTEPTVTSGDTRPTSITNTTDHRCDAWETNSFGSIPDTFGFEPDVKEQMQRKFADDLLTALVLGPDDRTEIESGGTEHLAELLKHFAILCRKRAHNSSQVDATLFLQHSRKYV